MSIIQEELVHYLTKTVETLQEAAYALIDIVEMQDKALRQLETRIAALEHNIAKLTPPTPYNGDSNEQTYR